MVCRIVSEVMLADDCAVDGDFHLGRPENLVCHGVRVQRLAWIEGTLAEHVVALDFITFLVFSEKLLCGSLEDQLGRRDLLQIDVLGNCHCVLEITVAETIYLQAVIN